MNNNKHKGGMNYLTKLYQHLLLEADKTTSRKEAIYLIHRADEVRLEMEGHAVAHQESHSQQAVSY